MKNEIQEFVDDMINPALASHGGQLTIVDYDSQTKELFVEMGGDCQGCAASKHTLYGQVSKCIYEEFPEISSIIDVTDHSESDNAYFKK